MDYKNIRVRTASPGDIDYVLAIEGESFDCGIREDRPTILQRLTVFPEGFLVMEYSGVIIGYISSEIWPHRDVITPGHFELGHSIETLHSSDLPAGGGEIYISSMGILKAYRGHSLGRLLFESFMAHVRAQLPSVGSAVLIVSQDWHGARKIYSDSGFEEVMRLESFFQSRDGIARDGLVMRLGSFR